MDHQQTVSNLSYEPIKSLEAKKIGVTQPFTWLAKGWETFTELKWQAMTFGAVFALIGGFISYMAINNTQLLFAFWSGFLFVAPMIAMMTFYMAKSKDNQESVSIAKCLGLLRQNLGTSLLMALFLSLFMVAWIRITTLAVAVYAGGSTIQLGITDSLAGFAASGVFLPVLALTAIISLLMFALLAWSMPMLADSRQNIATAIISSFNAVLKQPAPMLLWAAIVAGLTLLSMATFFVAFVVVFPWLGFATWEAYKNLFKRD